MAKHIKMCVCAFVCVYLERVWRYDRMIDVIYLIIITLTIITLNLCVSITNKMGCTFFKNVSINLVSDKKKNVCTA